MALPEQQHSTTVAVLDGCVDGWREWLVGRAQPLTTCERCLIKTGLLSDWTAAGKYSSTLKEKKMNQSYPVALTKLMPITFWLPRKNLHYSLTRSIFRSPCKSRFSLDWVAPPILQAIWVRPAEGWYVFAGAIHQTGFSPWQAIGWYNTMTTGKRQQVANCLQSQFNYVLWSRLLCWRKCQQLRKTNVQSTIELGLAIVRLAFLLIHLKINTFMWICIAKMLFCVLIKSVGLCFWVPSFKDSIHIEPQP